MRKLPDDPRLCGERKGIMGDVTVDGAGCKEELAALKAENAELRSLCGRAESACALSIEKHSFVNPPERCFCSGCAAAADVVREAAARKNKP